MPSIIGLQLPLPICLVFIYQMMLFSKMSQISLPEITQYCIRIVTHSSSKRWRHSWSLLSNQVEKQECDDLLIP